MCVERLKQQTNAWLAPRFIKEIENVLGGSKTDIPTNMGYFESRYTYWYMVQNLLLANKKQIIVDDVDLILKSYTQAVVFIQQHKNVLDQEAIELGFVTSPVARTGTKTEKALNIFTDLIAGFDIDDDNQRTEILIQYQKTLDMSHSGALTYYHLTKKRYLELQQEAQNK